MKWHREKQNIYVYRKLCLCVDAKLTINIGVIFQHTLNFAGVQIFLSLKDYDWG